MHFCVKCSNMYYISLKEEDSDKLIYYCRNCGHTDDTLISENLSISKTEFFKTESKFNNIINKYTKLDPTLPRINTIKCPSSDCKSNKNEHDHSREVIYLRYNDIDMKYLYLCCVCDYSWTTSS
jgi:DNA-directed RNA polymerase subunit M/transcription elongation factor TFIIS